MIGLAFDTETTGLIYNATLPLKKQPEIIEFYGYLFDDKTGKIKEELDLLIRPTLTNDINSKVAEITQITGITNEMLIGAPQFSMVHEEISSLFRNCNFITGHNLAFDMEMLTFEFSRLKIPNV